ncbi:unnamed protein product [Psylliodes chrysocephalus]|uniref:Uncharacterized protein n=1 Tax=Psylliodes chrysocephalus TaxID=3402493 RepID=A0A9P0GAX3_9CUCU|nr:unnamed protein product [Psylliodes chrysocephala]
MSQDESLKSNSESSGSSTSNQFPFYQEHILDDQHDTMSDPTLYGSSSLTRSGTVKRAGTNFLQKKESSEVIKSFSMYEDSDSVFIKEKSSPDSVNSRYRRSLDSTFRRSLESISEHKTKRSFSPNCTLSTASRCSSSLESFSSEPENAIRIATNTKNDEGKVQSPASSYLSWIGSVSNEFIATPAEIRQSVEINNDIDSKVGEWNNFWLNYNSARSRYMSSAFLSADDRTAEEMSEAKSINSNIKETADRPSGEFILMTIDEIHEALKCSKKITEIFQSALTRNDHDCENSNFETSYYSESVSRHTSSIKEDNGSIFTTEDLQKVARERSASYIVTTQDLLNKQKELLKPSTQSSSTSCINAILNTGVADILKRVMNKRRDIMTPDDMSSMTRRSFSEWSSK